MSVTVHPFGRLPDGREIRLFRIEVPGGLRADLVEYGAALLSLRVPDRRGGTTDVVLGFDDLEGCLSPANPHIGAVCGRYANRISGARFRLDGVEYRLEANEGRNLLHGGERGFSRRPWTGRAAGPAAVAFTLDSPDGDAGFPGRLRVRVTYSVEDGDTLRLDYEAETDRPTVLNLTNHAYFNLAGHDAGSIDGHLVRIRASRYLPVNEEALPTGEIRSVEGTPLDLREPAALGERLAGLGRGIDLNYCLDEWSGSPPAEPFPAAEVVEPASGLRMECFTTEPGLQLYTADYLDVEGKGGVRYRPRGAFCLEAQHWPDSPNRPEFPSTVLRPGETYRQITLYRFSRLD